MSKVPRIRVYAGTLAGNNGASGLPTSNSNGTAVPDGRENETLHLLVTKANVADFDVHVFDRQVAVWFKADQVSFAGTGNEAQKLLGLTGFSRVYAQRTDANVANTGLNTFWGFSEP